MQEYVFLGFNITGGKYIFTVWFSSKNTSNTLERNVMMAKEICKHSDSSAFVRRKSKLDRWTDIHWPVYVCKYIDWVFKPGLIVLYNYLLLLLLGYKVSRSMDDFYFVLYIL